MTFRIKLLIVHFLLILSSKNMSYADSVFQDLPDVSEKLGSKIDLDLSFENEDGQIKTIRDMFDGQKTLILTLNYFRCTTMCVYQFLNLADVLKKSNLPVGQGYTVASISFDPTDDMQRAKTTHDIWLKQIGGGHAPWHFYTVGQDKEAAVKIAKQLNFYFEKDDEGNYSHTGGLFFIDDNGELKRYLYGIVYKPNDLKFALIETSNGKIGGLFDKFLIKFAKYNIKRGRYEFYGS